MGTNRTGETPIRQDALTIGQAQRSVIRVISGGTPSRTGAPIVPSPRFTYSVLLEDQRLPGQRTTKRKLLHHPEKVAVENKEACGMALPRKA